MSCAVTISPFFNHRLALADGHGHRRHLLREPPACGPGSAARRPRCWDARSRRSTSYTAIGGGGRQTVKCVDDGRAGLLRRASETTSSVMRFACRRRFRAPSAWRLHQDRTWPASRGEQILRVGRSRRGSLGLQPAPPPAGQRSSPRTRPARQRSRPSLIDRLQEGLQLR